MYTKEELFRRRAGLSSSKRDLLAQKLRVQTAAPDTAGPLTTIPKRPPEARVPLSSIQERFWFLQQLDPASVSYINMHMYELSRAIDCQVLNQAVRELVRRHDILRTIYTIRNGQIEQQIDPTLHLTCEVRLVDLQHLPESERIREARRVIDAERARPFLLQEGPPWSFMLVRLRPDSNLLLVRIHHMIADGWASDTIVRRELMALYHAFLVGQPSPLPDLPIQYADYAVWQRQQLQNGNQDAQLAYWTEHLAGAPVVLDLPTDFPRPPIQLHRDRAQQVHIPAALTAQLKQLSQHENATLFMTLLTGFGVMLARLVGQNDLLIGTSLAGRQLPELESLLGCFINTLPLRIELRDRPSFRDLLRRVRGVCFGAFANQDLPLEQIISALHPQRDLSRSLLYQVMFQMQNYPGFEVGVEPIQHLDEATAEDAPDLVSTGQGLCDLTMLLYEGEEITGRLEYDATLFAPATIARMVEQLTRLLAAAVADPDCPVASLPLLSEADTQRLLVEWNDTAQPFPHNAGAHALFERQAALTPDAIALVWQDQQLTYRQLNQRANRLARYLQSAASGLAR